MNTGGGSHFMKNKNVMNLSNLIEKKVKELETLKYYTLSDEFYNLDNKGQLSFLVKIKEVMMEIEEIKSEIDSTEDKYSELKKKYNNTIHDGNLWLSDVIL